MPSKLDKIPINNPKHDKRVKLTIEDKENIIIEYQSGAISINALARKYEVSKRSIQFILFPERLLKAKELYAERRKDGRYYDKKNHTESMKKHREHKKKLHENGLLNEGE